MKIRGFEFELLPIKDSYLRRAVQMSNKIAFALSQIGVPADDIEVKEEKMPIRKAAASASWYADGHHCHFSHASQQKYIDNLQVVFKVIELETELVLQGKKTLQQFIFEYMEKDDFEEERKKAREILQVDSECKDMELIDLQYKKLSKKTHPDMETGDVEQFKLINWAHKTIKRELV